MSQSQSTAIAVIDANEFEKLGIGNDSVLAHMLLDQVASAGGPAFDESLFADADTMEDYDGIIPDVPRLRVNVKKGEFISSKDESNKGVESITGVMLCRDSNNIFFAFPKNQRERVKLCKEKGFSKLLDVEDGFICRGLSDGKAQLNPQLTVEQVAEAKELGFGGATGRGCANCPMGQWVKTDDGNQRMCADSENVVWLDSKLGEPVVLGIVAGKTVQRLRKWIAAAFQFRGKKLNLFAFAVQLFFPGEEDENQNKVMHMRAIAQLTGEQALQMRQIRDGYKHMLERAAMANAHEGTTDEPKAGADNGNPNIPADQIPEFV